MPTRVQMTTTPNIADEDARSDAGRSVSTVDSGSADGILNVDNGMDSMTSVRAISCEPGELRLGSPVEPGEVIRQENGQDHSSKLVSKFSMGSPSKQTSVMQSLFSSFLPPNADNQGNAFWSNFIQQTAAAAAAHKASRQLNVEDDSEDESNCSERGSQDRKYSCKVEGCHSVFDTRESRDLHSMNIKLHCKMFENNQTVDSSSENRFKGCIFCDKSFTNEEALTKHLHSVHQGQQPIFNDQNFSAQMDSLKSKTPLIA